MATRIMDSWNRLPVLTLTVILCLLLVLAGSGCTQPAGSTQSGSAENPAITATQTDANHIVIKFNGGAGTEKLLEFDTTVTDSTGTSKTQATGSKLATTPVRIGATSTFTGSFDGSDHVVINGYFSDGTQKLLLDTYV